MSDKPHIALSISDERQAMIIKVAAVAVAAPRWIGALLQAEGVPLPVDWLTWWVVFSAACAAGMALVEAFAFAYCLRSWRGMSGRSANVMAVMIGISAVSFVVVLAPYIAGNVSKQSMAMILSDWWALLGWSVAVASSTILIIASVGYAQKRPQARTGTKPAEDSANDTRQGTPEREQGANETRTPATRDEFMTAWRANGHESIAALARELAVNPRTAQKWVDKSETE